MLWATFQLLHSPASLAFSSPQVLGSILSRQVLSALLRSSHSPWLFLVFLGTAAVSHPGSEGCSLVCTQVIIPFTFTSPHEGQFKAHLAMGLSCRAGCVLCKVFHMCLLPQSSGCTSCSPSSCDRKAAAEGMVCFPLGEPFHGMAWVPSQPLCRALPLSKAKGSLCSPSIPTVLREAAATLGMSRVCATVTLGGEGAAICSSAKAFWLFPAELWCRQG